jgi:lysozyme family protein
MPDDYQKPSFDEAVGFVLEHEGGYSDHPADPGGATQWGISLRLMRELGYDVDGDGDIDSDDVAALTKPGAIAIYRRCWWDRYDYGSLGAQLVAEKVFDLAVNMGASQAHRLLQRALRASGGVALMEDGALGPKTWTAARAADPWATRAALRSEAAGFYRLLSTMKPSLAVFLNGWLRRAYW